MTNDRLVSSKRSARGNILTLTTALMVGLIITQIFFCLQFIRIVGSHHEQMTAIEAAALVAANDLSAIIVDDPYFGYIGLSDAAPCGKGTASGDNYDLPVQSINTIFATIRLDMIIADQVQDPILVQYAQRDYSLARKANTTLAKALNLAIQPGGSGIDINRRRVTPYLDAVQIYQSNIIRMTGGIRSATLVPNSLQLNLGCIAGLTTNTQIPQPIKFAAASAKQQQGNYYNAFLDIPYDNFDFVFAALGNDAVLVDQTQFQTQIKLLPYFLPSIVQCAADELYTDKDSYGRTIHRTIHCQACAEPANSIDPRPAPGALTYTFPTGTPPELTTPLSLWNNSQLVHSPCDYLQTPPYGDYPGSALQNLPRLPLINNDHPTVGQVMSVGYYDWIRRQGYRLNIQAVIDMLATPFVPSAAGAGQVNIYQALPGGLISYTTVPITANQDIALSQNQWRATSGDAFVSGIPTRANPNNSELYYDFFVKDYVFQPGKTAGGLHAGEPFVAEYLQGSPQVTTNISWLPPAVAQAPPVKLLGEEALNMTSYTNGPAGGAVRPTYAITGVAVDFRMRTRLP